MTNWANTYPLQIYSRNTLELWGTETVVIHREAQRVHATKIDTRVGWQGVSRGGDQLVRRMGRLNPKP